MFGPAELLDERGVCLFSDPKVFADRWRAVVGLRGRDENPGSFLRNIPSLYVRKKWSPLVVPTQTSVLWVQQFFFLLAASIAGNLKVKLCFSRVC